MLEKRLTSYAIKVKTRLFCQMEIIREIFLALAMVRKNRAGQKGIKLRAIKVGPVTVPHRNLFRSLQRYRTRASFCVMLPELARLHHDSDLFLGNAQAGYCSNQSGGRAPACAGRRDESV